MQFTEVEIHVADAEETALFYERMGAEVVKRGEVFAITIGDSVLTLIPSNKRWSYHLAFNIPFEQVEESVHWLQKYVAVQPFEGEEIVEFPNWNARAVYFYDPAGNILELIGRKPFQEEGESPFTFQSILNISEVGWPVNDVDQAKLQLPFPVYSQFGEYFAAMGDKEGLFIVVDAKEKKWIPNDDQVEFSPCKVIATHQEHRWTIERRGGDSTFSVNRKSY